MNADSIATEGNKAIARAAVKEALQAQRDAIKDRESTIRNLQWSGKLTKQEKAVLYHATRAYGLDPALRELMVLGGNLYITVAGLVRKAVDSGDYAGNSFSELEGRDPDEYRYKCTVVKIVQGRFCTFEGIGRAKADKLNKVTQSYADEMAQTRALGRALRRAWPVSMPAFEELDPASRASAVAVTPEMLVDAEQADPDTGEVFEVREPGQEG